MATWAKVVLIIGLLFLLVGLFWATFALSTCQELATDLQRVCWGAIRWSRLLVPLAFGLVAIAVSLLGHKKRKFGLGLG